MTIEEIAKLANVSKSAVSLALNNKPGVSESTREIILNIAKTKGYIPKIMVKADQVYDPVKAIRIVACIKEEILHDGYQHEPFFSELIGGLENENRKQGYTIFFSSINGPDIAEKILALEEEFQSAGIIVIGTNLTESETREISKTHPCIMFLDVCYPACAGSFVVMNNTLGGAQAAEYLIRMGHTNIGYVASKVKIKNFDMRRAAFTEELNRHGLTLDKNQIFEVNPIMQKAQQEFTALLQNKPELPSAIFCESDNIAIGVLKAVQNAGISVPEDISIIGFDDIPHCEIVTPTLTTIRVPKNVMGSATINKLIEAIENQESYRNGKVPAQPAIPAKIIIDTEVVERNSVADLK